MTLSNLPPGVTGNEYAIAGADAEWEHPRWCDQCEAETVHVFEAHPDFGVRATCTVCDDTDGVDATAEFEPDPDDYYDRMREEREDRMREERYA